MPQTLCEPLQFPTGVTSDGDRLFVALSGMEPSGKPVSGSVLVLEGGETRLIASGLRAPVTGLTYEQDKLFISEGGRPGRISRLDLDTGERHTLLDDLPGGGDYQTNTPLIKGDWLYFGQGAATNSGLVSYDPVVMPWLKAEDLPQDLPGYAIELADYDGAGTSPGFQPFGQLQPAGTRLAPQLPCTSGVMRCRLDGSCLETVAWGLRNPFGLCALPSGDMLAIDIVDAFLDAEFEGGRHGTRVDMISAIEG